MRSPIADLLADLGAAFAAVRAEWFLFGAQAAIVYGVARLTGDVDVTARVPARLPTRTLIESLVGHGFAPRSDAEAFLAHTRVVPIVHTATGLPVDVVLAGPGLEDEFFARCRPHDIDGVSVPVVDVTDLVVMKILAGRAKDVEDVVTLLRVQGGAVDIARAEATLSLLESALGQSDLLPTLRQTIVRAHGGR